MYKDKSKSKQNKVYFKNNKNTCRRTVICGIYILYAVYKSTTYEVCPYNILEDEFSCLPG